MNMSQKTRKTKSQVENVSYMIQGLKLYMYHVFCFMAYMHHASDWHLRT